MKLKLILASFILICSSSQSWGATPRDQLLTLTQKWIGTPYGFGPLGEGEDGRFDQDPLYRFDQFDCVTFVETALSAALTKNHADFKKHMNHIRYKDGEVDYLTRNHFSEVDWIPNNLENGMLFEVLWVVQKRTRYALPIAVAKIDKKNWYAKKSVAEIRVIGASEQKKQKLLKKLRSSGRIFEVEVSQLPYVPFSEFLDNSSEFSDQILSGLPPVMVLSVVRPGWDLVKVAGTELNITHQALLLQTENGWVVRHATSDSRYQVVEDSLKDFLAQRQKTAGVAGIHLVGVNGF
ncbi:MAG: DUF1460 domain-containing protein [Xanthomonadaceae bacterium]|nr:DUF1460 domain-containing protein [Xanthomonadaceae bacterium]